MDCALKVFRRDVLAELLPESRGFFVNTEMMTRARQLGFAVARSARDAPPAGERREQGVAARGAADGRDAAAVLVVGGGVEVGLQDYPFPCLSGPIVHLAAAATESALSLQNALLD